MAKRLFTVSCEHQSSYERFKFPKILAKLCLGVKNALFMCVCALTSLGDRPWNRGTACGFGDGQPEVEIEKTRAIIHKNGGFNWMLGMQQGCNIGRI